MVGVKLNYKRHSLMKEMYYGMMQPTPEWAVYGMFLSNALFILIMVICSVFDMIPCSDIGNFIKVAGVGINAYLTLYFGSRTNEH